MSRASFVLLLIALTVGTCLLYRSVKREWVMLRQGERFFQDQRYPEAIGAFQTSWDRGLRCSELVFPFHEAYLATGQASRAHALTTSLICEGKDLHQLVPLTELYLSHQCQGLVASYLHELTGRYPHHRQTRFLAGRLYSRLGLFAEAARQYRHGLGESAP